MLKRSLLALVLATFAGTMSLSAMAQDNGSTNNQQTAPAASEHGHRHFDPQQRTEMLTKHLKLTSDQQSKVLEILKTQQSQMESLRSDSSLSQDDRRAKMMDIHKASDDQIRALLDPNQQKKFDEMQARHGQWGEHHEGMGATPDSQPK